MLTAIPTPNLPRHPDGTLQANAWPGLCPIVYRTADGGNLCPACANGCNGSIAYVASPDDVRCDPQWCIVDAYGHEEGNPVTCDHCGKAVESNYGPVD